VFSLIEIGNEEMSRYPLTSQPSGNSLDRLSLSMSSESEEGMLLQNPDSVIQSCNDSAARILGLTTQQLIGTSCVDPPWQAIHEDGSPFKNENFPAMVALRTGKRCANVVMGLYKPDGDLVWLRINSQPLFQTDTKSPSALVTTFVDITEQKTEIVPVITEQQRIEADLYQSDEFKRCILDSRHDCIKVLDLENRLLYMNPGGLCLLEIDDFPSCMYSNWLDFWQGDDRLVAAAALAKAKTGEVGRFIGYCPTLKGKPKWWEVVVSPILDTTGRLERLLSISRDITERYQVEQSLSKALKKLNFHMENSPVGIIEWDCEFRVTRWSKATENIFGWRSEEVVGLRLGDWEFVYPEDAEAVSQLSHRMLAQESQTVSQNRNYAKDGSIVHCEWYNSVLVDEAGNVVSMLSLVLDVSSSVRILQQEQVARTEAEKANRLKDEFLAVLSHELRSPLNPILGWSKLLLTRSFDAVKTTQALTIIERNARLQAQLIEDLLDVSRILQGKLTLSFAPINLISVITGALETVQLAAEAKSIQLQTVLHSIGQISGDSARLQQIVWNLLSNAIKFTPSGGQVQVRLEQVGTDAQIQVVDNGKGISAEFLPYVFEHFRQADSATTRKFGGLGLGLAIVKQLVELHGGTIQVDSLGEGQGATFTARLPLLNNHCNSDDCPSLPLVAESSPLSGLKILVVDDETDSRDFVTFVLEEAGAMVTTVSSATAALSVYGSLFNILVSDIGMPEMDGYMLMQELRQRSSEQNGQIPAIALTAYAGEYDQEQALAAGFQMHLSKPVEPANLIQAIKSLVKLA